MTDAENVAQLVELRLDRLEAALFQKLPDETSPAGLKRWFRAAVESTRVDDAGKPPAPGKNRRLD